VLLYQSKPFFAVVYLKDANIYDAQYCNSKNAFLLGNLFVTVVELNPGVFPRSQFVANLGQGLFLRQRTILH
jgi:hypothetical protein